MQRPAPLFPQNANNGPEPPLPGGFTATQTLCFLRSGGWSRNFVVLKLSGHVVQNRSSPPETEKPAGHHHVSSKVSEAQYQLLRKRCQGEKRKMWLTFSHHVYL
jgi:hypothetical protein